MVIDYYLSEYCCSSQDVSKTRKKITNGLFSCYMKTASKLLNYLNIVLSGEAFEHIFFRYRPFVDNNNKTFKILTAKWRCSVPLKGALLEKLSLNVDAFVQKKKKLVHIAFKIPISDYSSIGKLIDFISDEWEKIKAFFENYNMIYPRLINSLKRKFDYVLFQRKGKNGKQNLGKSLQQNSRCCAWDVHKKILFCEDLAIKKGSYISYCQKKKETYWRGKKRPA